MKKKILSSFLALTLILSLMLPASALGTGSGDNSGPIDSADGAVFVLDEIVVSYEDQWNIPAVSALSNTAWIDPSYTSGVYEGYYAQLTDDQQSLYEKLKTEFKSAKDEGTITISRDDSEQAFTAEEVNALANDLVVAYSVLLRDHPEMPWLVMEKYAVNAASSGKTATFTITLTNGLTSLDNSSFTNAISAARNEIQTNLTANSSTYETLKAIHDYLCDLITYDSTSTAPLNQSAYSALVDHQTVCAGYATSFKLLCDEFGIPCVYVSGNAPSNPNSGTSEPHAWNYAQVDGDWYAVDVTWDDQDSKIYDDFFLVGSETTAGEGWTNAANKTFSASHQEITTWPSESGDTLPYPTLSTDAYQTEETSDITADIALDSDSEDLTYGETLTINVTNIKNGDETVTGGTVALYDSDDKELAKVETISDGTAELSYETINKALSVGDNVLTVKYTDTEATVTLDTITVTLKAKPLTGATVESTSSSASKAFDGTNTFTNVALTLKSEDEIESGDSVTATANGTASDANVNSSLTFTCDKVTLSGDGAKYYSLAEEDVTGTVSITQANGGTYDITVWVKANSASDDNAGGGANDGNTGTGDDSSNTEGDNDDIGDDSNNGGGNNGADEGSEAEIATVAEGDAAEQTVDLSNYIPSNCGTNPAPTATVDDSQSNSILTSAKVDLTNKKLTFNLADSAKDGDSGTIKITIATQNYTDITITVNVTVTNLDVPVLSVGNFTKTYDGNAVTIEELTKNATAKVNGVDVEGTWAFQDGNTTKTPTEVSDSGTYTLVFTPDEDTKYQKVEIKILITITEAESDDSTGDDSTGDGSTGDGSTGDGSTGDGSTGDGSTGDGSTGDGSTGGSTGGGSTGGGSTGGGSTGGGSTGGGSTGGGSTGGGSTGGDSTGGNTGGSTDTPSNPDPVTSVDTNVTVEATVTEGSATSTIDDKTAEDLVNEAVKNESENVIVTVEIPEDTEVNEVKAELPASVAADLAENTNASLTVETPVANIVIPNNALAELSDGAKTVSVSAAVNTDSKGDALVTITVQKDDEVVDTLNGGLKVNLPVMEDATNAGLVAVLVDANGNETVIKKSALSDAGMTALLDGSCTVKVVDNTKSFDDVSSSDWFVNAAAFASSHELFLGVTETEFAPESPMTRGMLVTVLHRLENTPASGTQAAFGDVGSDAWYTDAVYWASQHGIVTGYSEDSFAPDDNITREQMAVMMYRYVKYLGLDVSASGKLDSYHDTAEISDWAQEAMQWAVGAKLIDGISPTELNPSGTAKRSEVATILMRFVQMITE